MIKQPFADRVRAWFSTHIKVPLGVRIAVCVLPAVLTALFYILRTRQSAMDWFSVYAARPIRGFFGMLSSIYPLALMEILCTLAGFFLIYYIIKALRDSSRKRDKWKILGRRALGLIVAVLYVWSAWVWLWNSGYHASNFTSKSGLSGEGVTASELTAVTEHFAQNANRLGAQLERDEDGTLISNRSEMLTASRYIYRNISEQFPSLRGTVYAPKPMYLYSWLMSATGYSGMFFALTGESMVNMQQHPAYMPATASHEIAHQLGVYAEDEANFAGILACVTSEDPLFEYSGYLTGLGYLSNALYFADTDEYERIMSTLTSEVKLDRAQHFEFWQNAGVSDIGVDFLDNLLNSLSEAANTAVDTVYDGYLRANNQELGLQSYGACVNLLVEYFMLTLEP